MGPLRHGTASGFQRCAPAEGSGGCRRGLTSGKGVSYRPPTMSRSSWLAAAAFGLAAVVFFARLGELPLIDPDEGRNASVALEMLRAGEWLVPTYNGVPYLDKPALYFTLVAASFAAFGRGEAAARLPSATFGLLLLVLLHGFCRREYGRRTAALAVVVVSTTPLAVAFARMVIFDLPLAFCTSAAILCAYRAEQLDGGRRARLHLVATVGAAAGTLLKGPVGVLVPGLVLLVYFGSARRGDAVRRMLAPANLGLFLALTLPWLLAVNARQPDFLRYGLVEESLRRYGTGAYQRPGPVWYYVPVVAAVFFPWTAALPEGLRLAWRRRRALHPADRLLIVWAVAVVLFFSISRSKLPGYVLSGVVAAAVLVARYVGSAGSGPGDEVRRSLRRTSWTLAASAAILAGILLASAARPDWTQRTFHIRGAEWERARTVFSPLGWSLAAVALVAAVSAITRRTGLTVVAGLLVPVALLTTCFPSLRRYAEASSARDLAAAVPVGAAVLCLECFAPGLPFYLERPVVLATEDGRELTSNYVLFRLRRGDARPTALVGPEDLERLAAERRGSLMLISTRRARDRLRSLAGALEVEVRELRRGWWGATLPAPEGR